MAAMLLLCNRFLVICLPVFLVYSLIIGDHDLTHVGLAMMGASVLLAIFLWALVNRLRCPAVPRLAACHQWQRQEPPRPPVVRQLPVSGGRDHSDERAFSLPVLRRIHLRGSAPAALSLAAVPIFLFAGAQQV